MDVDVDACRVNLKKDEVGNLFALGDEVAESLHHGIVEAGMAHEAAVDEKVLRRAFLPRRLGFAHKAAYPDERRLYLHGQQLLAKFLAKDADDALQGTPRRQLHQAVSVARQRERDGRIDQCDALEVLDDVVQLSLVRLEELPPCRHIEEEVAHQEVGSNGTRAHLLRDKARAVDAQLYAQVLLGSTCGQSDLCHGSDGGKGFAAKAHRAKREKVFGLGYLGRGMTLESHTRIRLAHALAVVDDLYGRPSSILH